MHSTAIHRLKHFAAYGLSLLLAGALVFVVVGRQWWQQHSTAKPVSLYLFEGLQGPAKESVLKPPVNARWQDYESGSDTHLAILLTDPASAWMGLAQGFRNAGIPFVITQDTQRALRHRVVLVYPTISGKALSADALQALARHPAQGGTLIGFDVEGGGLQEVFGFSQLVPSSNRHAVTFDTHHPLATSFTHERERTVRFAAQAAATGSVAYTNVSHAVARFDDGAVAMTSHQTGPGRAYALGIDLGALMLTGFNNREEGISRSYVNEYEPALDVWLRLFRQIYMEGEPLAVTVSTVPQGQPLSVVLSHDIDYSRSLHNAPDYAKFEASQGVSATYFIQTKYIRDWNDEIFFNLDGLPDLRALLQYKMEVASHSVAHSQVFNKAALGDGHEAYPDYKPFVHDKARTDGLSVFGELRVSKFLLEHFLQGYTVRSFRPGHLKDPYTLPQALEATGYHYSSSVTANNSLTHLPFRLTHGREGLALTPIYEFPVSIEDEALPRLGDRVPQALALAANLARYGGLMMVLIHTDIKDHKLDFEKAFVSALHDKAWFGTLRTFGDFWAARDQLQLGIASDKEGAHLTLIAPAPIDGLTFQLPHACVVKQVVPATLAWKQRERLLILEHLHGQAKINMTSCS
jgi:hypothetical protein